MKDERRKALIKRLHKKLDNLRSLRDSRNVSDSRYWQRWGRYRHKLECRRNSLHWESIDYLCSNYDKVYLPEFESQEIRQNRLGRLNNRHLDFLGHYRFKERLTAKCEEVGVELKLVNECYTSKTCGGCGHVNSDLGGSKVLKCGSCGLEIARDVNGARNILIKSKLGL